MLVTQRPETRAAAALGVAACAGVAAQARGEGQGFEGVFVPDVEPYRRDRVDVPWRALSVAGLVILFVVVAAAVIFLTGRATERRRRRPPRSILGDGRR